MRQLSLISLFVLFTAFTCSDAPVEENATVLEDTLTYAAPRTNTSFGFGYSAVGFPYLLDKYSNEACFNEIYDEIAPKLLRFPGGTVANFYHPDGPGYGYKKKDIELIKGKQIDGLMSKQLKKQEKLKPGTDNFIYPFIEYIKGDKTAVLLVANIYTGTVKEALSMIKTFEKAGIEIAGIELGNECYMTAYENRIASGKSYWQLIAPFKKAISSKYPDLPIGIVLAPTRWHKESGSSKQRKYDSWNSFLSKQKGYDAVISHIYPRVKCTDQDVNSQYECAQKKLTKYVANELKNIYSSFNEMFPSKAIWIKEWNIKNANDDYGNSLLQASFIADFMNTSFTFSQETKTEMLLTFHNLSGGKGGTGNTMISEQPVSNKAECAVGRRAAHYIFITLETCYNQLESVSTTTAKDIKTIRYNQGSASSTVIICNGTNTNEKMDRLKEYDQLPCHTFNFSNLYSGNGTVLHEPNKSTTVSHKKGTFKVDKYQPEPYQIVVLQSKNRE